MEEKVFRTKLGYCHILPDKIVLSKNRDTKSLEKASESNTIYLRLLINSIVAAYFFYIAVEHFRNDKTERFIVFAVVGLFLVFVIVKSLNNSSTSVIYRSKIKRVKFHDASALTRAYFTITFEDSKGRIKTRLVMLPGSLTGGSEEKEKARAIMEKEGLLGLM